MRLSAFILERMEPILQEREEVACSMQPPYRFMDVSEYRDHAQEILEEIAATLDAPAPGAGAGAEAQPARGNRRDASPAEAQLKPGFNIDHPVCEYRALRASVLDLWLKRDKTATWFELEDMKRFNDALDDSLAESIARYAALARRSQGIFLGLVGHDLRTPLQCLSIGAQFLMMSEKHDPKLIQLGSRMYDSATRMSQILDDVLDFTRSRISNALQHDAPARDVTVRTSGEADGIRTEVHNHGEPIAADEQASLFDPLHRCAN